MRIRRWSRILPVNGDLSYRDGDAPGDLLTVIGRSLLVSRADQRGARRQHATPLCSCVTTAVCLVSPDGKQIAITRVSLVSDVVLIKGLR